MNSNEFIELITLTIGTLILIIILSLLMAFPTMWLWNWLMPKLFNLQTINLWVAFGINILSNILFRNYSLQNHKNL